VRGNTLRSSLFLCFASWACLTLAQNPTEENSEFETITGTVLNKLTREPVSRALVFSPDNRMAKFTDNDGRFQFEVPKDQDPQITIRGARMFGATTFSARKPGFLPDPEVPQTLAAPDLVILLIPEGVIQGRVLSNSAELAVGMNVQLFKREVQDGFGRWDPSQMTRTNSSGEYRFAELTPGEYKVMTQELLDTDPESLAPGSQLYGFPPACFPGVLDFASGTTITLTAGQKLQADIPLSRQPYYRVSLPVLNAESLPGLNVSVLAQAHPGPGYSLGYNPGTHKVEGLLPNGTFSIQLQGFTPAPTSGNATFTIAGREASSPSIVLTAGGVIPINVHEEFTSAWEGQSTWTIGKRTFEVHGPRQYLHVWLEPIDDFSRLGRPALRPPVSRPDEPLVVENVLPGAYWVRFNVFRGYVQSITSNELDLLHQPLVVLSGSSAQIDITMRDDTAEISGTIVGLKTSQDSLTSPAVISAQGLANQTPAYVYCVPLPDSNGTFQQITVMPNGVFQSTPMAPGAYRVLAFAHPKLNLPYRDAVAMRAYDTQGQVVNLVPGQTERLQLQMIGED